MRGPRTLAHATEPSGSKLRVDRQRSVSHCVVSYGDSRALVDTFTALHVTVRRVVLKCFRLLAHPSSIWLSHAHAAHTLPTVTDSERHA